MIIPHPDAPPTKKRKIQRACDHCRRYKRKCDGPAALDNICSLCKSARRECTYVEASQPRGPPKAYVTGLEDRVELLENILSKLRPGEDFTDELGPPIIRDSWKTDPSTVPLPATQSLPDSQPPLPFNVPITHTLASIIYPYTHDHRGGPTLTPPLVTNAYTLKSRLSSANRGLKATPNRLTQSPSIHSSSEDEMSSDEEGDTLAEGLKQLTLETKWDMDLEEDWSSVRFIGRSSGMDLIGATMRSKFDYQASDAQKYKTVACPAAELPAPLMLRRPEAWKIAPFEWLWEGDYLRHRHTEKLLATLNTHFPPSDLAKKLLDKYFSYVNPIYPVFHRLIFMRQYAARVYEEDYWFAAICLLIFAVASRWSDDPRVLPNIDPEADPSGKGTQDRDWRRSGYTWFRLALDVVRMRHSFVRPASLSEIQTFPLLALYLRGTGSAPSAWPFINIGLKKCQDVGAHRRAKYGSKPTYQDELWKRAFWCLVVLDRFNSASSGQPCGLDDEHFDVSLPREVDDDYWSTETEVGSWEQPADKPAIIMIAFRHLIKLSSILALPLRPYNATRTAREFLSNQILDWQEKILTCLSKACEDWKCSIPPSLQWPAEVEDELVFNLSANLYLSYYQAQISVFRPFISSSFQDPSPTLRPTRTLHNSALSACLVAAQSCLQILSHNSAYPLWAVPEVISSASTAIALFSIRMWDLKGEQRKCSASGGTSDPAWETELDALFEDAGAALQVLKNIEPKWEQAASMQNLLEACLPTRSTPPAPIPPCAESEGCYIATSQTTQCSPPYNDRTSSLDTSTLSEPCVFRTLTHEPTPQQTTWPSRDFYSKHDYQWTIPAETQGEWALDAHQTLPAPTTEAERHTTTRPGPDYKREHTSDSVVVPQYISESNLPDLPYQPLAKPYEQHALQHRYPPMANIPTSYEQPGPLASYGQLAPYNRSSTSDAFTHTDLTPSSYDHPSTPALSTTDHGGQDVYIGDYQQLHSRLPHRHPEQVFFQYPP